MLTDQAPSLAAVYALHPLLLRGNVPHDARA